MTADDFSIRPARGMTPDDFLTTGKYRSRFHRSPHLPHGWDAGVLFEETCQTEGVQRGLAALKPETLAVMHGSS